MEKNRKEKYNSTEKDEHDFKTKKKKKPNFGISNTSLYPMLTKPRQIVASGGEGRK